MTVYRGIVRGNRVVLPEGVHLADGLVVEVDVAPVSHQERSDEERERSFVQGLEESGVVGRREPVALDEAEDDFTPIEVSGTPLSQMIIEERR